MNPETKEIILEMKQYLRSQRNHRATGGELFDSNGFSAVYSAVNRLGYLDKDPE